MSVLAGYRAKPRLKEWNIENTCVPKKHNTHTHMNICAQKDIKGGKCKEKKMISQFGGEADVIWYSLPLLWK